MRAVRRFSGVHPGRHPPAERTVRRGRITVGIVPLVFLAGLLRSRPARGGLADLFGTLRDTGGTVVTARIPLSRP
jgi:hypothetical protein